MYKIFRIIFCILSVICAAATVLVLVFDWRWGIGVALLAVCFTGLMFIFKNLQTSEELKKNPPPPRGDYITGRVEPQNKNDAQKEDENGKQR